MTTTPAHRPRVMVTVRHHPRPEHRQDLLDAMSRINASSAQVPGLILDAAFEEEQGSILAVSLWSSPEAVQPGMAQLLGFAGDVDLSAWESRPPEMSMLRSAL
jgi:hypothetical protein